MPLKCCMKILTTRWILKKIVVFSQLCAGPSIANNIIGRKKMLPPFYSYSGEGRAMTFKKLKQPLKNWKPKAKIDESWQRRMVNAHRYCQAGNLFKMANSLSRVKMGVESHCG